MRPRATGLRHQDLPRRIHDRVQTARVRGQRNQQQQNKQTTHRHLRQHRRAKLHKGLLQKLYITLKLRAPKSSRTTAWLTMSRTRLPTATP